MVYVCDAKSSYSTHPILGYIMSVFEQASYYTFNTAIKQILIGCSKNKFPQQFKVSKGKIMTMKGNHYTIPTDPMDLCNLVQRIYFGQEESENVPIVPSTRRKGSEDDMDMSIYAFCMREAERLGRDIDYIDMLYSCIYTGLYTHRITPNDIKLANSCITSILGINVRDIVFESIRGNVMIT